MQILMYAKRMFYTHFFCHQTILTIILDSFKVREKMLQESASKSLILFKLHFAHVMLAKAKKPI